MKKERGRLPPCGWLQGKVGFNLVEEERDYLIALSRGRFQRLPRETFGLREFMKDCRGVHDALPRPVPVILAEARSGTPFISGNDSHRTFSA